MPTEYETDRILDRLIEILQAEGRNSYFLPRSGGKPELFRALCNLRPPAPVSEEFLRLQDCYLSDLTQKRGIMDVNSLEYQDGIALWQGDIARLNAEAIVNACNAALLGCFQPLHNCIDNVIHSFAGVQVRLDCDRMMKGRLEKNGGVRVTSAIISPRATSSTRSDRSSAETSRPRTAETSKAVTAPASPRRKKWDLQASPSAVSRRACSDTRRKKPRRSPSTPCGNGLRSFRDKFGLSLTYSSTATEKSIKN